MAAELSKAVTNKSLPTKRSSDFMLRLQWGAVSGVIIAKQLPSSMIINNNPYNLPDKPHPKQNRVYTESLVTVHRDQFYENAPTYEGIPRSPPMKKNSSSIEEQNLQSRQLYAPLRAELRQYPPSPSSQNAGYASGRIVLGSSRVGATGVSSVEKREQTGPRGSLVGRPGVEGSQVSEKIENIYMSLKNHEKRLRELESVPPGPVLSGSSQVSSQHKNPTVSMSTELHEHFARIQQQCSQNINKLREQICSIQQGNRVGVQKQKQADRAKFNQEMGLSKNSEASTIESWGRPSSQQFRKQLQAVKNCLEEKLRKNYQFLTSVIGRIERELTSSINSLQPVYKASGIKCTGTATLLRFVQCFKVRKNTARPGEKVPETKLTLADNTYYIDEEGFLLDREQFYLVDGRGSRVKLDDRHIRMLKDQGVI